MDKKVVPIGKFILEHTQEIKKEIELELEKISVNNEEWAVLLDYSFKFSPNRLVDDCFYVTLIPYIDDKKHGTFKFKFKSIETIFLKEICETMYSITINPSNAERILDDAKVTIEYLKN